jgi:hypothetical protein
MTFQTWSKGRDCLESPGPAAYSVPAPFGGGPHYTLKGRIPHPDPEAVPQILFLPSTLVYRATTFGYRGKGHIEDPVPAVETTKIPMGEGAPKYSLRSRYPEPPNTNPGPADYTISRDFPGPLPTVSEGHRTDFVDPNIIVSPDTYTLPSSFTKDRKTIAPAIPRPEPERNGPGPSAHVPASTLGQETPAYTVPHGPRDIRPGANPGPADYQRIRSLTSPYAIGTVIKNRTELPRGDLCDYPYHKYPGCISPRKFSHGTRPATSYETLGTGPAVDNRPPAIESRAAGIGRRPKAKAERGGPGPADYFKTPLPPPDLPICGFDGPTDRCPVDTEKERKKPGPGYYEQPGQFDKFRTGFYFTSRMMDDYVPDTAGPYVRQFSGLEGPKWTIGQKGV